MDENEAPFRRFERYRTTQTGRLTVAELVDYAIFLSSAFRDSKVLSELSALAFVQFRTACTEFVVRMKIALRSAPEAVGRFATQRRVTQTNIKQLRCCLADLWSASSSCQDIVFMQNLVSVVSRTTFPCMMFELVVEITALIGDDPDDDAERLAMLQTPVARAFHACITTPLTTCDSLVAQFACRGWLMCTPNEIVEARKTNDVFSLVNACMELFEFDMLALSNRFSNKEIHGSIRWAAHRPAVNGFLAWMFHQLVARARLAKATAAHKVTMRLSYLMHDLFESQSWLGIPDAPRSLCLVEVANYAELHGIVDVVRHNSAVVRSFVEGGAGHLIKQPHGFQKVWIAAVQRLETPPTYFATGQFMLAAVAPLFSHVFENIVPYSSQICLANEHKTYVYSSEGFQPPHRRFLYAMAATQEKLRSISSDVSMCANFMEHTMKASPCTPTERYPEPLAFVAMQTQYGVQIGHEWAVSSDPCDMIGLFFALFEPPEHNNVAFRTVYVSLGLRSTKFDVVV